MYGEVSDEDKWRLYGVIYSLRVISYKMASLENSLNNLKGVVKQSIQINDKLYEGERIDYTKNTVSGSNSTINNSIIPSLYRHLN